ncbi:hypothetical protein A2U01_0007767, partial [Trifolium medium]|nr:hypothetical protein [Trifolium medium]
MGLEEFTEIEIRSNVAGMEVVIKKVHFVKLLGLEDWGKIISAYKDNVHYRKAITKEMVVDTSLLGKAKGLNNTSKVLFKILLSSIFPRTGGTDTISWEHMHFLYFLQKNKKINLAECLFEHLCGAISDGFVKRFTTVAHPRLLSELFYQCRLVQVLKKVYPALTKEKRAKILDASFL